MQFNLNKNLIKSMKIEVLSKTQDNYNFQDETMKKLEKIDSEVSLKKNKFHSQVENVQHLLTRTIKRNFKEDQDKQAVKRHSQLVSPRNTLAKSVKLRSDAYLIHLNHLNKVKLTERDFATPSPNLFDTIEENNSSHTRAESEQVERYNPNHNGIHDVEQHEYSIHTNSQDGILSDQNNNYNLQEIIEGSNTLNIKGRIKKSTLKNLKPIRDDHHYGAMGFAKEKLRKAQSVGTLKMTNSLKTQVQVCSDHSNLNQDYKFNHGVFKDQKDSLKFMRSPESKGQNSPRELVNIIARNRVASKFNPDVLMNVHSIKSSSKGSTTILKTEDNYNKFAISSNNLSNLKNMNPETLAIFRFNTLRELSRTHKDGMHNFALNLIKRCEKKLIKVNTLGEFQEVIIKDINHIASKQSNFEQPTQFLFKILMCFATNPLDFKIDFVKFAHTIFLHTTDNNQVVVYRDIPKIINYLPVKDYDSFVSDVRMNVKLNQNPNISQSVRDKLTNFKQNESNKVQDGSFSILVDKDTLFELRQKQSEEYQPSTPEEGNLTSSDQDTNQELSHYIQNQINENLTNVQSVTKRSNDGVSKVDKIENSNDDIPIEVEQKKQSKKIKRYLIGSIMVKDTKLVFTLNCSHWHNESATFSGDLFLDRDERLPKSVSKLKMRILEVKTIDFSRIELRKEDLVGHITLHFSNIQMAVCPHRVKHTLSSMFLLDNQRYEVESFVSKVCDESIFASEPLTKQQLVEKLMSQNKDTYSILHTVEEQLTIFSMQQQYSDQELMRSFKFKPHVGKSQGNVNIRTDDMPSIDKFENFARETENLRQIIKEIEGDGDDIKISTLY